MSHVKPKLGRELDLEQEPGTRLENQNFSASSLCISFLGRTAARSGCSTLQNQNGFAMQDAKEHGIFPVLR